MRVMCENGKTKYLIQENLRDFKHLIKEVTESVLIPGLCLKDPHFEITCPKCQKRKWIAEKDIWYECPDCKIDVKWSGHSANNSLRIRGFPSDFFPFEDC